MSKQKYPQASSASSTSTTGKRNVKTNGYSSNKMNQKRDRKRFEAEARQATYDKLTTKQKLATLVPNGSNRQRVRLEAKLAKETEKKS